MVLNTFNLKTKDEVKVIKIDDMDVAVKQYLPAADKNNLLQITLQSAGTSTVLDTFAADIFFHTYLVIKYTDISFSKEDLDDIFSLYDKLESNGIINAVLAAIPDKEYETLTGSLQDLIDSYDAYSVSSVVVIDRIANFLAGLTDEIKNIDPEKLKETISSVLPSAE